MEPYAIALLILLVCAVAAVAFTAVVVVAVDRSTGGSDGVQRTGTRESGEDRGVVGDGRGRSEGDG